MAGRVSFRPATEADIPELFERLKEQASYFEQVDLRKMIVFVAEYEGKIVGFTGARQVWQIEPILLTPEFVKTAPHFSQQKATLGLINIITYWLKDTRNNPYLRFFFCVIKGRTMQKLAAHWGMLRIYQKCGFYGKDL